ncbi:Mariner Mos1 transposase [Eumeta japonica]|uniref:Mariner Mos1 transposase n=1 Tax=Eumeta variegata TaxID=151549 RepID=A0A4C1SY37_EUMVA|nr:Mariner Mos1 transposase [Eumeta japonica]
MNYALVDLLQIKSMLFWKTIEQDRLITGDEQWISYEKNLRKSSRSKGKQVPQTKVKPGLTRNKLILCVWWDWKGIIHYELLSPVKTINSDLCWPQLMRLKQEVDKKRPELANRNSVEFHHNARPHISSSSQQILREIVEKC